MSFKEQEQFTKKNSVKLLSELIDFDGENIMAEILATTKSNMEMKKNYRLRIYGKFM